jgi:hypothetical protein
MDDFEQLFHRWEIATAGMLEYACSESFVAPEVRDYLIFQLQLVADRQLAQMWLYVRHQRQALPVL